MTVERAVYSLELKLRKAFRDYENLERKYLQVLKLEKENVELKKRISHLEKALINLALQKKLRRK